MIFFARIINTFEVTVIDETSFLMKLATFNAFYLYYLFFVSEVVNMIKLVSFNFKVCFN